MDSTVSFHWAITSGASPTHLTVNSVGGSSVYSARGDSGGGVFNSDGGPYDFKLATCQATEVHISGSYVLGGSLL